MSAKPLPPGPYNRFPFGELLAFLFDRNFLDKRYQRYGPIFRSSLFGRPAVFLVGAEAAEFLLASGMVHFSWGEGWPATFRILLGRSLFLQDGEEHRRNRKLMMPAFHGQALAEYVATMDATVDRYLKRWEKQGELRWFEEFKQLTFDIASELLLGAEPGAETARLSELFTTLTNGLFSIFPVPWKFTKFGKAVAARNALLEHLAGVVRDRQQHPKRDALSLLVQARDEEGNSLSSQELQAQAMLLLFAGHETTTSMATWLCLELARHPEVLQKARAEQQHLAAQGDLDLEQLNDMPYLDRVISEVERLHPPVGGGFRGVVQPFEFQGYAVPAGWLAQYSIFYTQRLPELYPEPERFDPDRFGADRPKRSPYALLTFGGGPRICLGLAFAKLEMKMIAARLLRGYRWELLPGQRLEAAVIPTRRPKDGLQVRFARL